MNGRRALLSVSDKTGLVPFARSLAAMGWEILSTGGTASALRKEGLAVTDVSEVTGFPEMMDGRVKTLHPKVHGGLLALRDEASHVAAMEKHGIRAIDLLCVNLYPFEATVARGASDEDTIEQIDIGGPAMVRSASKNHRHVIIVTSPSQYDGVIAGLQSGGGRLPEAAMRALAVEAFRTTARYDAAIASWLGSRSGDTSAFPALWSPLFERVRDLRYGENPMQKGALYAERGAQGPSIATGEVLSGKELSYNNILDLDAALRIVREFAEPCCVVMKHANPCGAALGATPVDAARRAFEGDPVSAFGSIVGFNRTVDLATAEFMAVPDKFVECVVAPDYEPAAVEALTKRTKWGKNVRLVRVGDVARPIGAKDVNVRRVLGGLLVQDYDQGVVAEGGLKTVTKRAPTAAEQRDLDFAWLIGKHVMSNAIVLVKERMVVGVGAGQMSRVDSADIAVKKAGERAKGAVAASDAFFPFADGLESLLRAGVTAAAQPGGSMRDAEVIAAADAAGAAMVFTGMRHFRH